MIRNLFNNGSYIILSGQIQIEEEGKSIIRLEEEPFTSFLQFSEVLEILLHSSVHLVISSPNHHH